MSEPIPYHGNRDALQLDGWIRSVERFAAFHKWDDVKTFYFALTLLRDRADAWYRTVEIGDKAPSNWLELKRLIIEYFRPDNSVRIARDKLCSIRQTGDLVAYINEFMDLKLSLPGMNEEEAVDRFIRGLSLKRMRAYIRQNNTDSLQVVIRFALSFDSADKEYFEYMPPPRRAAPQQRYLDDPMDIDALDEVNAMNNYQNRRMYNNNQRNNSFRPSNYNNNRSNNRYNNSNSSNNHSITCHYCGKKGHVKNMCITRREDIRTLDNNRQRTFKKDFQ